MCCRQANPSGRYWHCSFYHPHCCNVQEACLPVIKLNSPLTLCLCVSLCVCALTDLFSLFASDLGGYAAREDIEAVLQVLDGEVPASLKKCFSEVSKHCSLSVTTWIHTCTTILVKCHYFRYNNHKWATYWYLTYHPDCLLGSYHWDCFHQYRGVGHMLIKQLLLWFSHMEPTPQRWYKSLAIQWVIVLVIRAQKRLSDHNPPQNTTQ